MEEMKENKTLLSIIGAATGVVAAAAFVVINRDNLFGKKKDKKPIEKLHDMVQKSRTNVEDILNTINSEAYKVRKNGKSKLEKVL